MRAILLALALGAAFAASASAADLSDAVWTKAPDRSDWAKAYPADAAKAGISGSAQLRCSATADGLLANCAVVSETPSGQGFGAAALSLTGGMELRTTSESGQLIAGKSVLVPVKFTPEVLRPGAIIGHPDWLQKPKQEDMQQYWPANSGGAAGNVLLHCVVTNRGLLEKCQAPVEQPTGHGFAAAALAMTPIFLMRPMTVDGEPVGGAGVSIPIRFEAGWSPSGGPILHILRTAPWTAVPTPGDIAAAFPKGAVGRISTGHVVLRCALRNDGRLFGCDTVSEEPPGHGFANAARSLTKDFHTVVGDKPGDISNIRVDIPFDFRDPTQAGQRLEVVDPFWLERPGPAAAAELFPAAAAKAGLKQGSAKVDCRVTHDGLLNDCRIVQESPTGLGFGDAALKVAGIMKMNPWTAQGAPVDGARITLPVTLVKPEDPAPAAAPAKP